MVQIIGSGIREVTVRLRRTASQIQPLDVSIPVATYFIAGSKASQNMVSIAASSIRLANDDWITIAVPAACANKPRNIPNQEDRFSIARAPQQAVLVAAVRALDSAHATYPVIQAGVWIITNDATYDGLGTLVYRPVSVPSATGTRVIDADAAAKAMKILGDAGINIKQKAIWRQDHNRLAGMVNDQSLAEWLRSR